MSPLTEALIVNGAVLIAVLEGDLGPHRKIGRLRILRPLITVAAVIPLFIDRPSPTGTGCWSNWRASRPDCSAAWSPAR